MPVEYSPSITSARIIPSLLRCPPERGKITLPLVPIAGRQVMEHLGQAAGLELLDYLFLRERIGEKILDPGEPDFGGRGEAIEEG